MNRRDEITQDFIDAFPDKQSCTGAMARIMAIAELPEGVDGSDPEVIKIVAWCRENYEIETP